MTDSDLLIASEQVTPAQLVAKLAAVGVTASVSVIDNPLTGERTEGVNVNHRELADALTSGKYGLPEALTGLVQAAATRTLTKSPIFIKGVYFPDIAYCVLGWGGSFLVATTAADREAYLEYLWAARKVVATN